MGKIERERRKKREREGARAMLFIFGFHFYSLIRRKQAATRSPSQFHSQQLP